MKVAIVHYHLGLGGVSQVITTASRVLTEAGIPHVILVGDAPQEILEQLPVRVVPGLGYSKRATPAESFGEASLPEMLRAAAFSALGSTPDIWHFHNHSLGKNPWLADAVARLAEENERIVLQIHDLAEGGRPANYRMISSCGKIYPVSPRVRYAFLNARDQKTFTDAGLPADQATVIVNPVDQVEMPSGDDSRAPILFAPVRGIRRKNLGELVFLSALAPEGVRFALSRAPANPEALAIHDAWSRFSARHRLPIGFDVVDRFAPAAGASADFTSWMEHATHFVTTSVAEGFGLPFLEAAAHGKPLVGRNLKHIAEENARHGIHAGNLYDRILVPAEWIDLVILREHLTTTLERSYRAYRRQLTNDTIQATFDTLVHDGWVDFGNLTEPLQQGVIERLADPGCRRIPRVESGDLTESAVDWLAGAIANRTPSTTPDQLAPYAPAAYGREITAIYADLCRQPDSPVRFLPPARILTSHLAPGSFHFLLSVPKPDSILSHPFRAVIFDIYGTLLIAPAGGVKPDPAADPMLRTILERAGHAPPESPSSALHAAVLRHHAAAGVPFPEVDVRVLWREILALDEYADVGPLVDEIESAWHPSTPMPGAAQSVQRLSRAGVSLGLLSNAQSNTPRCLGGIADLFAPELTILSYQHGVAKPSTALFELMVHRLAGRGIRPEETLFVGNDPLQDIAPAAAHGFKTALFTGHPESLRPGDCTPDCEIGAWSDLSAKLRDDW